MSNKHLYNRSLYKLLLRVLLCALYLCAQELRLMFAVGRELDQYRWFVKLYVTRSGSVIR